MIKNPQGSKSGTVIGSASYSFDSIKGITPDADEQKKKDSSDCESSRGSADLKASGC
jgi:hypothetical protein